MHMTRLRPRGGSLPAGLNALLPPRMSHPSAARPRPLVEEPVLLRGASDGTWWAGVVYEMP